MGPYGPIWAPTRTGPQPGLGPKIRRALPKVWQILIYEQVFDFEFNFQPNPDFRCSILNSIFSPIHIFWHFRERISNKFLILNTLFNPIQFFGQELKQLLQLLSEQMFVLEQFLIVAACPGTSCHGKN